MELIDHAEKVVKVPLAYHSEAISPPYQSVTQKMMDIPKDGGTKKTGGLRSVRIISTSGAQLAPTKL